MTSITKDDVTQIVNNSHQAEKPRVFSGLPKEAIGWLEDFTYIADANGWDNAKKTQKLGAYLTSAARDWFTLEIFGKSLTWDEVREAFHKQFLPVNFESYVRNELRNRKQAMY